jgi:hypothetical protein
MIANKLTTTVTRSVRIVNLQNADLMACIDRHHIIVFFYPHSLAARTSKTLTMNLQMRSMTALSEI